MAERHVLTPQNIRGIKNFGQNGIYINSNNTEKWGRVRDVIGESVRVSMVKLVKTFFRVASGNEMDVSVFLGLQRKVVAIIDDVLENKDVLYNLVDLKIYDDYTYQHSVNVTILSVVMGINIGLSEKELKELALSAIIHDIGKVFIPSDILNKKSSLTGREFEKIKTHVIEGSNFVCSKLNFTESVHLGMVEHHERWDGSGYPYGHVGRKISLFGRIIAVADVYDALSSDRPYRKRLSPSDAFEYVVAHSGSHFDPEIIRNILDASRYLCG